MQSSSSQKHHIEKTLLHYILPFFKPQYIAKKKEVKKKIRIISDLEKKIEKKISKINKKNSNISIKTKINNDEFDEFMFKNIDVKKDQKQNIIDYKLEIRREKNKTSNTNYSVKIKYEIDENKEKLEFSQSNDLNQEKDYSLSLHQKKPPSNYHLKISYYADNKKEIIQFHYKENQDYKKQRLHQMHNFEDRVPGKFVNVFPESLLGGVLGFTYLGENFMGKREDMIGNRMVDIHESIHTPDEYETRILTSWIMDIKPPKYFK